VLAQQSVDQITVAIGGLAEEAPATANHRTGFANRPGPATGSVFATTSLPELGGQNGCDLRLLLPGRLMAEDNAALQKHRAEVPQCEAAA
jgi:hypothetical protein